MEEVKSNPGMWGWSGFNTLLGAAGTAMGATALGSKTSEQKVREIIREENCGYGRGRGCGGYNCGGVNEVFVTQPCSDNTLVNRFELEQNLKIADLQAKDYSNTSDLKLFEDYTTRLAAEKERVNGRFETIFGELVASRERMQAEICRLDKESALNKQASDYQFLIANKEFDAINGRVNHLTARVNAITKEVIPLSALCPQPLPGCVPVAFEPQTITTENAGAQGVIIANKAAAASNGK